MDEIKTIDLFAKPQRDEKGRFIKGNDGVPPIHECHFCRDQERILNKIELFSLWSRGKVDKKLHMPYIQVLCDEDYLDVPYETFHNWLKEDSEHNQKFHLRLMQTIKKLYYRREHMLLNRTFQQNATGAIFQLKANHGYVETEKRILAGDKGNPVEQKLEIEIVEAKKHSE